MNQKTVNIETLTTQGEGIARVDGKATFVPFTLPGETWTVEIVDSKKRFDRALPIECIERDAEAPERIEPQCPHFGVCGGCRLQHVPYEDQLELKRLWLQETFNRIAHLDVEPKQTVGSPPWEYRNKVTLSLQQDGDRYVFAYHQIYKPDRAVFVEDCPIAHPLIRKAIPFVLKIVNRYKPKLKRQKNMFKSRVQLRVIDSQLYLCFFDIFLKSKDEMRFVDAISLSDLPILEMDFDEDNPKNPEGVGDEDIDDASVSSNSFFQINDAVRDELYRTVLHLPYQSNRSVLDGYCGVGLLTCSLTERFERVVGVELNRDAAGDAKRLVKYNGLTERVRIHSKPLERFLQQSDDAYDVYVLNPPRAGLSNKVRQSLIQKSPKEIVIVSCHPAALARDVQGLIENSYQIQSIHPFDMFPQTFHLETVVHLVRS